MKAKHATLLLSLLLSLPLTAEEDRFAKVEITPTQLAPSVWLLEGAGGNIGVSSGDDGILIIDDQFAPLTDKIAAALKATPGAQKSAMPRFIINTHYHGDHIGGNDHFGKQGTILAHDNVLKRLATDGKTREGALPVVTFDAGLNIRFNGDTLKVMHLGPGHTDGDSLVIFERSGVVHMGDLFFKDRFPYIDLDGGGSVIGYRDNVERALAIISDDDKVIPGHGSLANRADLLKFKQMLDDSITWAKEAIASGKSLEQMQAEGLGEKYQSWSWNFIDEKKWIAILHRDLSAKS